MTAAAGHKLAIHDKGERVWGECSCSMWAWMGTYVLPKGKRAKLRAAHQEHATRELTRELERP